MMMKNLTTISTGIAFFVLALTSFAAQGASFENDDKNCYKIFADPGVSGLEMLIEEDFAFTEIDLDVLKSSPNYSTQYSFFIFDSWVRDYEQKKESFGQLFNFLSAGGLDYAVGHGYVGMRKSNSDYIDIIKTKASSHYAEYEYGTADKLTDEKSVRELIRYIKKHKISVCK